jgi:hypothetical protein
VGEMRVVVVKTVAWEGRRGLSTVCLLGLVDEATAAGGRHVPLVQVWPLAAVCSAPAKSLHRPPSSQASLN